MKVSRRSSLSLSLLVLSLIVTMGSATATTVEPPDYDYVRVPVILVTEEFVQRTGFNPDEVRNENWIYGYLPHGAQLTPEEQAAIEILDEDLLRHNLFDRETLEIAPTQQLSSQELLEATMESTSLAVQDSYHTYEDLYFQMKTWANSNPNMQLNTLGNAWVNITCPDGDHPRVGTDCRRQLWFMRISTTPTVTSNKPMMVMAANIHGDEVVGREMVIRLIDLFDLVSTNGAAWCKQNGCAGADDDTVDMVDHLLANAEILLVPSLNPDGNYYDKRQNCNTASSTDHDTCYSGLDLNRDYPQPERGDPDTSSGRGLETQHVMDRLFKLKPETYDGSPVELAHPLLTSVSYHGGLRSINMPYADCTNSGGATTSGCIANYPNDGGIFPEDLHVKSMNREYINLNNWIYTSSSGVNGLNYGYDMYGPLSGTSKDWITVYRDSYDTVPELTSTKHPSFNTSNEGVPDQWEYNRKSMVTWLYRSCKGFHLEIRDEFGQPVYETTVTSNNRRLTYGDTNFIHRLGGRTVDPELMGYGTPESSYVGGTPMDTTGSFQVTIEKAGYETEVLTLTPEYFDGTFTQVTLLLEGGAVCPNDVREGSEVCDGADLAGETCESLGYDGGTLACLADCSGFDTSACEQSPVQTFGETTVGSSTSTSGNLRGMPFVMPEDGTIQSVTMYHTGGSGSLRLGVYLGEGSSATLLSESAETPISGTTGWQEIALQTPVFVSGGQTVMLAWLYSSNPGIRYVTGSPGRWQSSLTWSGDGSLPDPFGSSSQSDYIYSIYASYTTVAPECPNGVREAGEVCDAPDLGGETCVSQGFDDGTLDCLGDCSAFDTTGCYNYVCSNDIREGTEVCDGTDLAGETCVSQGFDSGTLGCLPDCSGFDTSACVGGSLVVFEDDFENGNLLGWTYSSAGSTATTGDWTIGDPVGTSDATAGQAQPENAYAGSGCVYTDENPSGSIGTDDVDGGVVYLLSPMIDLAGKTAAELEFVRWYFNRDTGEDSGDFYVADVSDDDGSTWVNLETLGTNDNANSWTPRTFALENYISLTSTVRLRFGASDGSVAGSIIEAAIDDVKITASSGAPVCPNGIKETGEVCDAPDLGGDTCVSQGFDDGTLDCLGDCSAFDTTGCYDYVCPNNIREGSEVCDGTDLGGETCVSQGFDDGTLGCLGDCSAFDTGGCYDYVCPNNIREGTEVCDGTDLAGEDCVSQGFDGGSLACLGDCTGYDTSSCTYTCGNNSRQGTEVCDGTDLGGETCVSQGFDDGTLDCLGDCSAFDTTGCYNYVCSNNIKEGSEVCDGSDLAGEDCVSQGLESGTLGCLADCSGFDTSACVGGSLVVFEDDFESGNLLGWTYSGAGSTATTGDWTIGDPVGTSDATAGQAQPESAYAGSGCVYTAENPSGSIGTDDVDGGVVYLVSPPIDLADKTAAELEFVRWYFNRDTGEDSGDFYVAEVSDDDGATWVNLETLGTNDNANSWTPRTFTLEDYISLTSTVRLRFGAADGSAAGNIIEAAIDNVKITASSTPPVCPNGTREPGEACDGDDLAGETCESLGYDGGALGCLADCSAFDTSGCQSATTETFGVTTVGSSTSTNGSLRGMPFTMPEDGTIQSVTMYHSGGSGSMRLGVYLGEGSSATLLSQTAETPISGTTGWQEIALQTPVFVSGGQTVMLAWLYSSNPGIRYDTGSPGRWQSSLTWSDIQSMPDPFGSSSQSDYIYSIYATYSPP